MTSPDGRLSLVFNGMIYNHRELRARLEGADVKIRGRCDTEVLLAALATWGPASLELLNGMWAFAAWDQGRRTLTLCRDRLGIKPLVYHLSDRQVACGSEIGALHHLGLDGGDLDAQALHHYLTFMQVPAPLTIYERFRKLSPATLLGVSETGSRSGSSGPRRHRRPRRTTPRRTTRRRIFRSS